MSEAEAHATGVSPVRLRVPGARLVEIELSPDREGRFVAPKGVHVTTSAQRYRSKVTRTGKRGKGSIDFRAEGTEPYGTLAVAKRLVDLLGNNTVADLLGVAKDRPSRWVRGEGVEAANRAALADLEALVGRLLAALTPDQAALWLTGDNAYLGARPIDVFRMQGSGPVVEAIAAREQGAFA